MGHWRVPRINLAHIFKVTHGNWKRDPWKDSSLCIKFVFGLRSVYWQSDVFRNPKHKARKSKKQTTDHECFKICWWPLRDTERLIVTHGELLRDRVTARKIPPISNIIDWVLPREWWLHIFSLSKLQEVPFCHNGLCWHFLCTNYVLYEVLGAWGINDVTFLLLNRPTPLCSVTRRTVLADLPPSISGGNLFKMWSCRGNA